MAGVRATLNWDDTQAQAALADMAADMADFTAVFKDFGEYMLRVQHDRFSRETGPEGKWKALSPVTLKTKKHHKILTESGDLRGSINYRAAARRFAIGTNKIYGAIHQFGGKAGPGHRVTIPARPYLGFTMTDIEELKALVKDHLGG